MKPEPLNITNKKYISTCRARSPLAFRYGEEWRVLVWGLGTRDCLDMPVPFS